MYCPVENISLGLYSDPLSEHPDVYPEPVFGPSILFAGQPARWTGDSVKFKGQVGIEARVTFEAYAGRRATSYLEIFNDGTTCIYYDWQVIFARAKEIWVPIMANIQFTQIS